MNLDCQSSGFVYYIGSTMYFEIIVNKFSPQSYYVLFDEGVGVVNSTCKAKSSVVTDSTFWTFTVSSNYAYNLITKSSLDHANICSSNVVNYKTLTKCNLPSMMLLFVLFYLLWLLVNLLLLKIMHRCLNRKQKTEKVKVRPYFFKLNVPSTSPSTNFLLNNNKKMNRYLYTFICITLLSISLKY